MSLVMVDAAYPNPQMPKVQVLAAYMGGDTPHVWTLSEWNAQSEARRLPIWVRSNPGQVNVQNDIVQIMNWINDYQFPKGVTIALDLETAVDANYVSAVDKAVVQSGRLLMKYGSHDYIYQNPPTSGGVWVSDPTGTPHLNSGSNATQYLFANSYDLSLISDTVPLWDLNGTTTSGGNTRMLYCHPFELEAGKEVAGITFARGTCSNVALRCDNTYYGHSGPLAVRVAVWADDATGGGPSVEYVEVSNQGGKQVVVPFGNPGATHGVDIARVMKDAQGDWVPDTNTVVPVYAEVS